jgi:O-antigen/teichoic acid export membrane protein
MCLLLAYRKNGGPRFSFSMKKARQLLSRSSGFILSGLMVAVYASTDKLMLKQMLSEAAVGHYALATSLSTMWCFALLAIINSMAPGIVRLFSTDREAYLRRNRQLYAIVFYLCVLASGVICLLAEPIIRILYGESYLGAVAPLRIVVWYTAFSYLGVARNTWMVCENRQKYLKYLYLAAAAVNVILNLLLIPAFGGAGAAAASLVTQTVTILVMPALIRPLRPNARMMLQAIALKGVLPSRNHMHNEEGTES